MNVETLGSGVCPSTLVRIEGQNVLTAKFAGYVDSPVPRIETLTG